MNGYMLLLVASTCDFTATYVARRDFWQNNLDKKLWAGDLPDITQPTYDEEKWDSCQVHRGTTTEKLP